MENPLFSLPTVARTILIDPLDDKGVSDGSSVQFHSKRRFKNGCKIFQGLDHLGDSPGEATWTGLLVLSAQVPPLYLKSEDDPDTATESDETKNEPASGCEDYSKDESENDCSMPSLDDMGFIDIQPPLEDAETEMLKLIWSLTSCKREYYGQEGPAILRRILATEGAKLFFIESKRLLLRRQMLSAVANGLTPKQQQFTHLILVFWATAKVVKLANDLLQKQPNPEQERILQFLTNSGGLFNKDLITQAIDRCHVTLKTITRFNDPLYHLLFPEALRYVIKDVYERRTILPKMISEIFPKTLATSLTPPLEEKQSEIEEQTAH